MQMFIHIYKIIDFFWEYEWEFIQNSKLQTIRTNKNEAKTTRNVLKKLYKKNMFKKNTIKMKWRYRVANANSHKSIVPTT